MPRPAIAGTVAGNETRAGRLTILWRLAILLHSVRSSCGGLVRRAGGWGTEATILLPHLGFVARSSPILHAYSQAFGSQIRTLRLPPARPARADL
jgi:hypothetical protein